jgi:hypothetical protein
MQRKSKGIPTSRTAFTKHSLQGMSLSLNLIYIKLGGFEIILLATENPGLANIGLGGEANWKAHT